MLKCVCEYNTSDRSNFKRHQKRCRRTHRDEVDSMRSTLAKTQLVLEQRELELHQYRKKIFRLESHIEKLRATHPTLVRDCNIFVTNVFPYATESAVVPREKVHTMLSMVSPSESIPRFVQLKHFCGPLAARNIYLPNRRGKTVLVVEAAENGQTKWVHKDRRGTVDEMLERNLIELRNSYSAENIWAWKEWLMMSGLSTVQRRSTSAWKEQMTKLDLILVNHQQPRQSVSAAAGNHPMNVQEDDNVQE